MAISEGTSGALGGGGVPGLWMRQVRAEMSERSISAVAMFSSNGCSREMDM